MPSSSHQTIATPYNEPGGKKAQDLNIQDTDSRLVKSESASPSVVSDSLQPYGLYSPWNSPGQNIDR